MRLFSDNPDFYPTPNEVISQMLLGEDIMGKVVLEPSAGSGNIVKYLKRNGARDVIACEKDPHCRMLLNGLCNIIAEDFLTVTPEQVSHVNYIVMNPPFSRGAEHILHAWEIAPPGCTVIALCNTSSVDKDSYYSRNQQLCEVIKLNGSIELAPVLGLSDVIVDIVETGKTLLENWGSDVKIRACARAAAGSDARMSGCPLPVVINSGSGNQGITVTMPVLTYAEEWGVSHDKTLRALLVSNLVSVYIKHYIGALSAFCGAVSAGTAAGAAITYMAGGDYDTIAQTITNTLGNVGGIICDGAKSSCGAKIASAVNAALMAHHMAMSQRGFKNGEGFVAENVEKTIKNMGYIGKVGMAGTDIEILNVMIDKVDVDKSL